MAYISAEMPKSPDKKRFEVHLLPDVIKELERISKKENRSLKNLLETIIKNYLEQNKKQNPS